MSGERSLSDGEVSLSALGAFPFHRNRLSGLSHGHAFYLWRVSRGVLFFKHTAMKSLNICVSA